MLFYVGRSWSHRSTSRTFHPASLASFFQYLVVHLYFFFSFLSLILSASQVLPTGLLFPVPLAACACNLLGFSFLYSFLLTWFRDLFLRPICFSFVPSLLMVPFVLSSKYFYSICQRNFGTCLSHSCAICVLDSCTTFCSLLWLELRGTRCFLCESCPVESGFHFCPCSHSLADSLICVFGLP